MNGVLIAPDPPLLVSATVTVTVPLQLSASSVIRFTSATGISEIHSMVTSAGAVPVGAIVSSIV